MDGYSRRDEGCPKLLDLIPKERKWFAKGSQEASPSEDQKLVLSLGPPGGEWAGNNTKPPQNANSNKILSFSCFSNSNNASVRNHVMGSPWHEHGGSKSVPFLHKDLEMQNGEEKKVFSPAGCNTTTAQKRTAPAPVVGWPPVRSFRKNLASSSSSKTTSSDSPTELQKTTETVPKSLFVKINMDGIPIGRKVDLKAYDSYQKLSHAVDELFRGLRAAQSELEEGEDGVKKIGDLLDGNGDYTLVYEDNEGDRMLVGDVPWQMFVSNVKRLRVLKSSDLPKLSNGGHKQQGKLSLS